MIYKITIFLLLFFVFSFLFRTDTSFNQDLGRHLKLGEIILQTHQVPKTNLFSYTNPNFTFINSHWLFEIFVYLWTTTFNLQSLLVLKILLLLFSVWLTLKITTKQNDALLLPLGFIFLHILRERLELRPEIFSFLFTATTYYILEKYLRGPTKLIFLLPFIQLIWINTHIYFFVGLVLQGIFLIHLSYQKLRLHLEGRQLRLLSIVTILSAIASLFNPNGISGILYPLNVTQNYGYTIAENQTMFLLESLSFRNPNFLFVKISIMLLALSLLVTVAKKKFDLKNILLAGFGAGLALLNVRSFPYLVFLSLPATLSSFGLIKLPKFLISFLLLVTFVLLLLESYLYLNGNYYKYTDADKTVELKFEDSIKGAMDFVISNNLDQPIFNNFDIGSYIIYKGYPKYKVFVDGRPEAYPAQFFTGVYIPSQSDYKNFKELENIYNFKTIVFSHTDQTPWGINFLQNVIKDPSWKIVYLDDFMIILTNNIQVEEKKLIPLDLSKLNPNLYNYKENISYLRIGLFLIRSQNNDSALRFIQKSSEIFPESPIVKQLMRLPPSKPYFW